MFIELTDILRCRNGHSESHLVAVPSSVEGRTVVNGVLGCPTCRGEYPIVNGILNFGASAQAAVSAPVADAEYEALRCAALLNLQVAPGYAALCGEWGALAPALLDTFGGHLILVNPAADVQQLAGASVILCGGAIPLTKQSLAGIALDEKHAIEIGTLAAAAIVRSEGRMVAPLNSELPDGVQLLASDDRHWVAEVSHAPIATITLRRNNRT